jgi:regulator of CtrA degradation
MSIEQAGIERKKVRLGGLASATEGPGWDDMPERLRELIARSVRLQERVRRLDIAMENGPASDVENPVEREFGRVAKAFGAIAR